MSMGFCLYELTAAFTVAVVLVRMQTTYCIHQCMRWAM
jgi:hypothetical protein